MSDDAGFAVAITIRQRVLNDSLMLSYHAGTIGHGLQVPIPDGPPDVDVTFFLDVPQVQCVGTDPAHLGVVLDGWGSLRITWQGDRPAHQIRWTMQLLVRPRFIVAGTDIEFVPERDDVSLATWTYTSLDPTTFPPDADAYLRGAIFRARLEDAAGLAIASGLLKVPPIDASFLGSIIHAANMDTGVRIVDGAVVLGLDIASASVTTTGTAELLADFARNNDIATFTNPVAVPVTLQDRQEQISAAVAAEGATLDSLVIAPGDGVFNVSGQGSNSEGSVSFSFDVVPELTGHRPGGEFPTQKGAVLVHPRSFPALGFTTANVHVDVDKAAWVVIVEVIGSVLGAVVPLIIEDLVASVAQQVTFGVETADVGAPVPRVQQLPALVAGDPDIRLEIAEFEISPDGVFTGITLEPKVKAAQLVGLVSIPSDYAGDSLTYRVALPLPLLADDPMLHVHWTILDLDTGHVFVDEDGSPIHRLERQIVPSTLGAAVRHIGIMVRVFSPARHRRHRVPQRRSAARHRRSPGTGRLCALAVPGEEPADRLRRRWRPAPLPRRHGGAAVVGVAQAAALQRVEGPVPLQRVTDAVRPVAVPGWDDPRPTRRAVRLLLLRWPGRHTTLAVANPSGAHRRPAGRCR